MSFKNEQGITSITMVPRFHAYCPLGKSFYSADVTVKVYDPGNIPDYCDIDTEVKKLDGTNVIIEDAVKKIFDLICSQIGTGTVEVRCKVTDAIHSPVLVERIGEAHE